MRTIGTEVLCILRRGGEFVFFCLYISSIINKVPFAGLFGDGCHEICGYISSGFICLGTA